MGEDAVTAGINFAIGGGILIAIIGTLLLTTQYVGVDTQQSDDQNLRSQAKELVGLLADSSGAGWGSGAENATEMGLLNANGSGIDTSRLAAMKGAGYDAAVNGKLDYDETMALMGLDPDGTTQFHVRVAPIGLQRLLSGDLSGIPTAYIGDYVNPDTNLDISLALDAQMVADAREEIDSEMSTDAALERRAITELGLGFDNQTNLVEWDVEVDLGPGPDIDLNTLLVDPLMLDGDVFPDEKVVLDAIIADVVDEYDIIIIGANVDHSTLTSNAFKGEIEDFVYDGGMLVVFGSDDQSFQWLQPILAVGIETANGGAYAPDVDHPLLKEPHALDWPAYDGFGQTWSGNQDFEELFQHIISDEEDGDMLAISMDGAFGDGTVFLSTYRPADIAESISLQEAMNFLNNIAVYKDRSHLYLDYGPSPPQDASIGAASRITYVWDPSLGQVPVRLSVLVW